jgi:excisionase family DNA binding protein
MTAPTEVTVSGCRYWSDHVPQLAQLLQSSRAKVLSQPGEAGGATDVVVLTQPTDWAQHVDELRDALLFASGEAGTAAPQRGGGVGVVAPVQDRLVYTVEEAAKLLGISRAFAYEAVKRGDIPSMRIGKRILVPKARLERFLASAGEANS